MDRQRQKPTRIRLKPGERWLSPDRTESAVITCISSSLAWGHDEEVRIHFLWQVGDHGATAILLLEEFAKAFPVRADAAP